MTIQGAEGDSSQSEIDDFELSVLAFNLIERNALQGFCYGVSYYHRGISTAGEGNDFTDRNFALDAACAWFVCNEIFEVGKASRDTRLIEIEQRRTHTLEGLQLECHRKRIAKVCKSLAI